MSTQRNQGQGLKLECLRFKKQCIQRQTVFHTGKFIYLFIYYFEGRDLKESPTVKKKKIMKALPQTSASY